MPKIASSICHALEAHGHTCWISSRDVAPGENYQGAIVRAITDAGAMVMVFSSNANNSEEIKKELALASQSNRIVIPVRAEDVLPSEDFRYELATRQWIDLFDDWEKAIETLGRKVDTIMPPAVEPWMVCSEGEAPTPSPFTPKKAPPPARRPMSKAAIGAMAGLALAVIAGGVWLMRPPPPPPPSDMPKGMMLMPEADMPHPPPPGMDPAKIETDLWDAVKDTGDAAALNSYLAKYPGGIFAAAAKARIEALNSKAPVVKTATAKPVAPAASAAHEMPMTMPMGPSAPGELNSNVQMAVSMARSAETRAREMAENAEQMAKLAEANTPGYGTQAVHGRAQWSGRLAAFQAARLVWSLTPMATVIPAAPATACAMAWDFLPARRPRSFVNGWASLSPTRCRAMAWSIAATGGCASASGRAASSKAMARSMTQRANWSNRANIPATDW